MGFLRVLQVDLKMENFPEPLGSRWMAWQVEYPASRSATQEVETEIRLAQEDLAGIVPLAMVSQCRVQLACLTLLLVSDNGPCFPATASFQM